MKLILIGKDIKGSKSKIIHKQLFLKNINVEFLETNDINKNIFSNNKYFNITNPFKEKASKLANYSSADVSKTKSANLIINYKNELHAYNTDFLAIQEIFKDKWTKSDKILIIGNGSMARNFHNYFLNNNKNDFYVTNKTKMNNNYKKINFDEIDKIDDKFNIIINATSVSNIFKKETKIKADFIYDVNYKNDYLKKFAKKNKIKFENGDELLYLQALETQKIIKLYQKINYFDNYIKKKLSNSRYEHSINVAKFACQIAKTYNLGFIDIYIASLIHDSFKEDNINNQINFASIFFKEKEISRSALHGFSASSYFYDEINKNIFSMVYKHTTCSKKMSIYDKVLFLADKLEKNRNYENIDNYRKLVFENIDKAFIDVFQNSSKFILKNKIKISNKEKEIIKFWLKDKKDKDV